ncbi:hypothetical protein [Vibrio ezurae]|uniref:Uncharacterized protein n=1 Tax=Vibrio ezurae NBRC 102218 TaxID=1219080 RepID=U3CEP6_9VIBR|nr:hypothetical protein [Vibrio ezurae]GAD79739.1 hypothetical protein VEZ01S_20_00110 [Vibrio ezurae NBRC 102218]
MLTPIIEVCDDMQNIHSPFTGRMIYGQNLDDEVYQELSELQADPSKDQSILFVYDAENQEYLYLSKTLLDGIDFDPEEVEVDAKQLLGILGRSDLIAFRQCGNFLLGDCWTVFCPVVSE